MRCNEIENRLPAYLENLLPAEEHEIIAAHIASCPRCSRAAEGLRRTERLVRDLAEVEPPPFFEQRIMSRIREESGRKKGLLRRLFFPLHIKLPIQALATVVIAVLAFHVYQQGDPEMKRVVDLPPPMTAQEKGRVETGLSGSPAPPPAVAPLRGAPAADLAEPRPQTFAAPPPEKRGPGETAAGERSPVRKETPAAAKSAASAMASGEKDEPRAGGDGSDKLQERAVREDSAKAPKTPPPEPERKGRAADIGAASREGGLSASAPSPARMAAAMSAAVGLTIRVGDPEAALRGIEPRLERLGARIVERQRRSAGAFLKVEIAAQDIARLLDQLAAVGRVSREPGPPADPDPAGTVTVGITVIREP